MLCFNSKDVTFLAQNARREKAPWIRAGINIHVAEVVSSWADIKDFMACREPDNNGSFHVRDALVEKLAILYDISSFQPTLVLNSICQHLPYFVNEWAQFGGIWSLLEETIESSYGVLKKLGEANGISDYLSSRLTLDQLALLHAKSNQFRHNQRNHLKRTPRPKRMCRLKKKNPEVSEDI